MNLQQFRIASMSIMKTARMPRQSLALCALLIAVALLGCGESREASSSSTTPAAGSPPAPQTFLIQNVLAANASLQVAWSESTHANGYTVSAARRSGGTAVAEVITTQRNASLSGLNVGLPHIVSVRATNATGSVSVSHPVSVVPVYGTANPANQYSCRRNLYVSPMGSDSNDGTTSDRAFQTINRVTTRSDLRGGDCINLLPGEYTESVGLVRGGSAAEGFVVLRSTVPWAARVVAPAGAYSAIRLEADYLVVDGIDVKGGEGNAIDGCLRPERVTQHLRVLNNRAHRAGLSGIGLCWGDHMRVEGNVVHDNAWTNGFQGSGISIYQARSAGGAGDEPRIIIRNNIAYANIVKISCDRCHTDGNGIIVDDFRGTQGAASPWKGVVYPHTTLVENNLVFNNGGKGIHLFLSDRVTVRSNTAYHNNQDTNFDGTWRAELSNAMSSQNTWVNNIAVTDPSIDPLNRAIADFGSGGANSGVVFRSNLAWAGGPSAPLVGNDGSNSPINSAGGNLIGVDPRFVRASRDPLDADFRLAAGSLALGAGAADGPSDNINGVPRGQRMNIGAY